MSKNDEITKTTQDTIKDGHPCSDSAGSHIADVAPIDAKGDAQNG